MGYKGVGLLRCWALEKTACPFNECEWPLGGSEAVKSPHTFGSDLFTDYMTQELFGTAVL